MYMQRRALSLGGGGEGEELSLPLEGRSRLLLTCIYR
jgi:hypothetical protein